LFVGTALRHEGSKNSSQARPVGLGLPFLVAVAIIAPLAYYPPYPQRAAHPQFADFWRQWLSLGNWPAGPAWFVWLLLVFDCVAALLFLLAPGWGSALGCALSSV